MSEELFIICEVCNTKIGLVDAEKLATPMRGDMFKSLDPAHGRPAPFHPEAGFRELFCPYCRRRAMYEPDQITTQHGKLKVYSYKQKEKIEAKLNEKKLKETEVVEYIQIDSPKKLSSNDEVFFHDIPARYIKRDGHQVIIKYEDGTTQHVNWKMLKQKHVYHTTDSDRQVSLPA